MSLHSEQEDAPDTSSPWHEDQFWAFGTAMRNEWLNAREEFEPFHSLHEGTMVLQEELTEAFNEMGISLPLLLPFLKLLAQTYHRHGKRNRREIIRECVQIATMAYCIVDECLGDVTEQEIENYAVPDGPPADYSPF